MNGKLEQWQALHCWPLLELGPVKNDVSCHTK